MHESADLASLLRLWLDLAERETEAIAREDWAALATCQERIREIQARCETMTCTDPDGARRLDLRSLSPELCSVVTALLERERYNLGLLEDRRIRLQTEMDRWSHTVVRLRRVQQAVSAARGSGWSRLS